MSTTIWFLNDPINQAEAQHLFGGQSQLFRRNFFHFPPPPQNGRTTLGANDRVPGILHHVHTIADANAQCTTACALTNDHADHGHFQADHLINISRDRFALSSLLGLKARICTRRIDECNNRFIKFLRQFHQSQSFAIAFRVSHSEIAHLPRLCVDPFLLAYHHRCLSIQRCKATYHGFIVLHISIAIQLDKICCHFFNILQRVWPIRVATQLYFLPTAEMLCNFFSLFKYARLEFLDRIAHVHFGFFRGMLQLFHFIDQILDRFFKIKELSVGI